MVVFCIVLINIPRSCLDTSYCAELCYFARLLQTLLLAGTYMILKIQYLPNH